MPVHGQTDSTPMRSRSCCAIIAITLLEGLHPLERSLEHEHRLPLAIPGVLEALDTIPRRNSHGKVARRDRKVKTARTALHMSNTGGQSHVIKTVTCQPARANDTASLPGRSVPTSAQFQNEAILDHSQASQPTTQKHNNDLATTNHNNNAAHSLCKLHRQYAYSSARKQETSVQTTSRPSAMPPQPRKRSTFGLPA